MEFLDVLVKGFVGVLLIVVLMGFCAILFYTTKAHSSMSLVQMPVTFIRSFFTGKEKDDQEKNDRGEEKKAIRNRLYLLLVLNKDTTNSISHLNKAYRGTFKNVLKEPFTMENLEEIFLDDQKFRGIKSLLNNLTDNQKSELEKAEHFLHEIGINVQSDCNLDEELESILEKLTLTELFDKMARIKKTTGSDYKEAFNIVKTKRAEYIRGILDFDFSEDEIDFVENMKEIYTRINKIHVEERISLDSNHELDFVNLTDGNEVNRELNQANTSFKLPFSESLDMEAFTKKTLQGGANSNRPIRTFNDFDRNLIGKPIVVVKAKKQDKKNGSKR